MKYLLTSDEYQKLSLLAERAKKLQRVAEEKEAKLTEVGLILHEILGSMNPPKAVDGTACIDLARQVQQRLKEVEAVRFRAGDTVKHLPSEEEWVLAVDETNGYVYPCGWPLSRANAKDCVIVEKATDDKRMSMLEDWTARSYSDDRTRIALVQVKEKPTPPPRVVVNEGLGKGEIS